MTAADLSTIYRLADGALSPLEGPMKQEVYARVLDESIILQDGTRYAWTIPLSLPLTDAEVDVISAGDSAALVTEANELVAIVDDVEGGVLPVDTQGGVMVAVHAADEDRARAVLTGAG